jgi:hypothetical protein
MDTLAQTLAGTPLGEKLLGPHYAVSSMFNFFFDSIGV